MGAAESRDMPLLQKRRFTPDERKELRRNMHYNPDEELASGIEHAAEHKVTKKDTCPHLRGSILPDLQDWCLMRTDRGHCLCAVF